jgi:hypothetical protein
VFGQEGVESLPDLMVLQAGYTCLPSADSFLEALLVLVDQCQVGAYSNISPPESFYFGV